jgi:DNA-binding CsgD family transcriptional regulator
MADNVPAALDLIDRTLEAAGPDVGERLLIRCLDMRGWVANKAHYPDGRRFYEEGRDRAEAASLWYEECRALCNHAWDAILARDLPTASDQAQQAIASALRNELLGLESYTKATYATVLELHGEWTQAEDLARDQLEHAAIAAMVAHTTVGVIEARTGRDTARPTLRRAWKLAGISREFQRLAPTAIALAELAWISGTKDVAVAEFKELLEAASDTGLAWYLGSLAFWLWKLGELPDTPAGIAEPYRLVIEGDPMAAAEMWSAIGCPYERAIALAHGDQPAQLEALEALDALGATSVAAKLRKTLRDQGVSVPRGKGRMTRDHAAGLTPRQAEVLDLLSEGLSNLEIADRLFVSPRTVEHHVSAVLAKLDCSTREEAVSRARDDGLLSR